LFRRLVGLVAKWLRQLDARWNRSKTRKGAYDVVVASQRPSRAAGVRYADDLRARVATEVVDAWAPGIYRHVRALTRDHALAEDLLHEAFLRLQATLLAGKTIDHPRAWLHKVARRLVLDAVGSYAAHHAISLHASLCPRPAPPTTFEDEPAARWREIWRIGAPALSPRERECLQLRAEGFTHREIAGILQVRTGTVCTLVARAIHKVQRRVRLPREEIG
jgi:RNA polymerase sigma factor (sigma-70 family)